MTDAAAQIEALRAALAKAEARADANAAEAAHAKAVLSGSEALIAHLRLEIEKLRRELYGQRSERKQRLLEQLELQLEEMEATASEDEALAEAAAAEAKVEVAAFARRKPVRKPFPEHLPRERVVLTAPCACAACGSGRLVKMGEDVTETLEVIPRQWKVIQTVREKFTCRDCERISQPPAPFHPTPRGWAGPSLLAMVAFEKYGQHQPLNRQAERYAREGVELSLSTLADQIGATAAALAPLHALIAAHVMAAGRLHGDETPVPLLAKGQTETARLWTYVRDDRPFGGRSPLAALFRFSRDRRGEHPQKHLAGWKGVLQADAYAGFNALFDPARAPGPVVPAFCWAHSRRKFFELADIAANARRGRQAPPISPLALEAVKRIDAVFDLERAVNGLSADQRLAVRRADIAPLVAALHDWMKTERARLSTHAPVAKAMGYMLTRWPDFTGFLGDGRVCLTNNAAERSLRGVALGRKAWLFAGSERGGDRAAFMYTLIVTAKLNDVDPQAWLADVLARIAATPMSKIDELLPWNWAVQRLRPLGRGRGFCDRRAGKPALIHHHAGAAFRLRCG
jgi:transposase